MEVTGSWRKLHSEEIHNFLLFTKYFHGDQIKENEMHEACSTLEQIRRHAKF
jgi:hypothetical protein